MKSKGNLRIEAFNARAALTRLFCRFSQGPRAIAGPVAERSVEGSVSGSKAFSCSYTTRRFFSATPKYQVLLMFPGRWLMITDIHSWQAHGDSS